ncbi:MAG: FliA/WhiG family RNA polymerase sigma factor [Acidobacteria bacterium]|nr:FliA/WhiG family RNA polymerase sigma factor [Acidobacteriota bacterium]
MSCTGLAVRTAPTGSLNREQRDAIVIDHLPLVKAIAGRVRENLPVQVELDDLVHAGILGLFDAVQKYDPTKRVAFHLYAKHRIRGAILDSLRQLDWASRDLRKRYKRIEAMTQKLSYKLGRPPHETELAREMGVSLARWRKMVWELHSAGLGPGQSHLGSQTSDGLDRFSGPDSPRSMEDLPDRACARKQLRQVLAAVLESLPPRYQRVVALYYTHGSTMKQIGAELGVNESRVSQIHKGALEKLNAALRNRGIQTPGIFVDG